jgi:photosystem II stability/assembly factor-like uncharacterized protein
MSRPETTGHSKTTPIIFALWLIFTHLSAGHAQTGLADEWAEPMPLVESSLLLDADSHGSRMIVVGERGHVLLSRDRGADWQQVAVPTRTTLTAVEMVGGDHVWAVGHDGLILHSDDGGFTWTRQHRSQEPDRPLLDVWFADPRRGMAIGAYGLLLSTENGGRTWRNDLGNDEGAHANAIAEAPDGILYIAGEFGSILRSDDRGWTWQRLPSPYRGSFFGLLALHDGAILVFGLRGHLFRSEDRGSTWRRIETGTAATLLTGLLRADGSIVIAGLNGVLLLSDDGGRRFQLRHLPDRSSIAALIELGPDQLLAVGDRGLTRISARSSGARTSMTVDAR